MKIREKMIQEIQSRRTFYQMDPTIDNIDDMLRALIVDHSGPCDQENWMSMPSLASPLANAFETPVFFSQLVPVTLLSQTSINQTPIHHS